MVIKSQKKDLNKEHHGGTKAKIFMVIFFSVIIFFGGAIFFIKSYIDGEKNKKDNAFIEEITNNTEGLWKQYEERIEYGTQWTRQNFIEAFLDTNDLEENYKLSIRIGEEELAQETEFQFIDLGEVNIKFVLTRELKLPSSKSGKFTTNKSFSLSVEDTKTPIIDGVEDKSITQGEQIDLISGIKAYDEVDGDLEIKLEGKVDTSKSGDYIVKVSAEDKNGNRAEKTFKVTVRAKTVSKPSSTPSSSKKTNTSGSTSTPSNPNVSVTPDSSTSKGRLALATAEANRVVSQIITPNMSDADKAYAIFRYLRSNVSLQTNQSTEAYKTNFGNEAYAALIMKIAACSGFCKAVTLMCNATGLQSQHINAGLWTYQWNRVLIDGEWIILDAQGGIFGGTIHPLEY